MLGFALLRVRAHRLLFTAALLTVLLTTCVLATLAAFTGAIGDEGLHRTLTHQQAARTTVDMTGNVTAGDWSTVDRFARSSVRRAFGGLPVRVTASTRSGPFGLPARPVAAGPGGSAAGTTDLTLFATLDPSRIRLVSGRLPGPVGRGTGTVPVALPAVAARDLGLRAGSELTLPNRLGGPPVRIRITGTFRPLDPTATYWRLDPLGGESVSVTDEFTTYGPLLTDPSAFASGRIARDTMSWQATADFTALTPAGVGPLEQRLSAAITRMNEDAPDNALQTDSQLPDLLSQIRLTLLTGRATLLIDVLQLAVLAAVALVLVAGLLAAEQAGQTAVLRARGAAAGQLARLAGLEALLVAVPAAVLAPPLTGPLVRLIGAGGALAPTGVRLSTGGPLGPVDGWQSALCAAAACALAIVLPAFRRQRGFVAERAARLRAGALPETVRAGADLALLALAAVAYWQLRAKSGGAGVISADATGRLGVDPVLVAAPALCLLAGTLVVLRLLPLVARLSERRAARGRGLVPALAGWQLSRRPRRGTAPALLLVLAVALGTFAVGQDASWRRSQADQADFAVGTDIRVTGDALPPFGQGGTFDDPAMRRLGVTSVTPAARDEMTLGQGRTATVLALDTRTAAAAMKLRPDLAAEPAATLLRPLHAVEDTPAERDTGGFVVPGTARALRLTLRLQPSDGARRAPGAREAVNLTLKDRYGVAYSVAAGSVPADGRDHVLVADLTAAAGGGQPAGPLRLTGFEADYVVTEHDSALRFTVDAVAAVGADGTTRALPRPAGGWRAASTLDDDSPVIGRRFASPTTGRLTAGRSLSVSYTTGSRPTGGFGEPENTGELRLSTVVPPLPAPPAVATPAFLRAAGAKVGDRVQVQVSGVALLVRVTGTVQALPTAGPIGADAADAIGAADVADAPSGGGDPTTTTVDQDGGVILVDLRAVNRELDAQHAMALRPTEWWLTTAPGTQRRVTAALRADPDVQSVLSRDGVLSALRADPLGAGPQAVLPALVFAAAVLAGVGFAVSALGAVREREGEFAVLRALGAPRSRLARMIAAEQGLLALVALAVGLALGTVLTRLVVPLVVLTTQATHPIPALLVRLPAGPLLWMLGAVLAVPSLVVLATAVRRGDPASALRRQEEG